MLETRDLYKDYIQGIEERLVLVTTKIAQYETSIEYFKQCIINNRFDFEHIGVNIDTLFANPPIAFIKIKDLVLNGQLSRVAHYVKSYSNAVRYLKLHILLQKRLNKSIMPFEAYRVILASANSKIASHILKGGSYRLGNVGTLYILEKARTFLYNGKPVKLPVDWGLSNKYKKQLLDSGKIPYDLNAAPNGTKWHIYHNSDYAYWFWWERGAIPNRGFFKFIPSKFCKIGQNRKSSAFLATCKSKEDILNATNIGNIDKMLLLMKFDPFHFLNYKHPEKVKHKQVSYAY